ncbi:MAG: hypothetical protein ACXAD7_18765, partial [Candidatus Kariarchaeaceae archaeon]
LFYYYNFNPILPLCILLSGIVLIRQSNALSGQRIDTTEISGSISFPEYSQGEATKFRIPDNSKLKIVRILGVLWIITGILNFFSQLYIYNINTSENVSANDYLAFIIIVSLIGFLFIIIEFVLTNLLPKYDNYRKLWTINNTKILLSVGFFFFSNFYAYQLRESFFFVFIYEIIQSLIVHLVWLLLIIIIRSISKLIILDVN